MKKQDRRDVQPCEAAEFRGPYAVVTLDPQGDLQIDRYALQTREEWLAVVRSAQRGLRRRLVSRAWVVDLSRTVFSAPDLPSQMKLTAAREALLSLPLTERRKP